MFFEKIAVVVGFMCIHIFAHRLIGLGSIPRNRWLSFAGGSAVAYVFLHIFPELDQASQVLNEHWNVDRLADHLIYLAGLCGMVTFYGLERVVNIVQKNPPDPADPDGNSGGAGQGIFWLHMASFSLYNALIGYFVVHREQESGIALLLFAISLGFHFLVNDFGFQERHQGDYHRKGRWLLAGSIFLGWLIGQVWSASEVATSMLFAFLAGGIILNVLKEELPENRQSRFMPFAVGAAIYVVLIFAAEVL